MRDTGIDAGPAEYSKQLGNILRANEEMIDRKGGDLSGGCLEGNRVGTIHETKAVPLPPSQRGKSDQAESESTTSL